MAKIVENQELSPEFLLHRYNLHIFMAKYQLFEI